MARQMHLSPNQTTEHSGDSVFPSGAIHSVINDGQDSTYVDLSASGGDFVVRFSNLVALNVGEQIKGIYATWRGRPTYSNGSSNVKITVNSGSGPQVIYNNPALLYRPSPPYGIATSVLLVNPNGTFFTEAEIASMALHLENIIHLPASELRVNEVTLEIVTRDKPTVSAIVPANGAMQVPPAKVSWTFVGDGEVQTYSQVRIFLASDAAAGGFNPTTSTLAVYDSGERNNANHEQSLGNPLIQDGSYKIYARAAQCSKHWSDWVSTDLLVEHGPDVPHLTPNTGTTMDTAPGFTASWTYTHPSGISQASWQLRRKADSGSFLYWNNATSAWVASPVDNTGAATSKAFGAGTWPDGHLYTWGVSVKDNVGMASDWVNDSTILAVAPPSVNITAPVGTITTTTRPAITWTFSDAALRTQAAFHAKVFTAAVAAGGGFDPLTSTALYDSGVVAGNAATVTPKVDFPPDGTDLVTYVRVLAGSQWSAWDTQTFKVVITAPAAPTLTAVEDASMNAVTLTATGASGGTFAGGYRHYIEHKVPGGEWLPVRFGTFLTPGGGVSTVKDNEVPAQVAVSFRAKTLGITAGGGLVASPWSSTATCTLHPTKWWIKDVQGNQQTPVNADVTFKPRRGLKAGVFGPVGRGENVVISEETFRGMQSPLGIWIKNASQLAQIEAALVPGRTLLLQDVIAKQWYIRLSGDRDEEPLIGTDVSLPRAYAYRYEVPVAEVGRPTVT